MGGISVPSLLIILGIIVLVFGTAKFRNIGGDLGAALKGFKKAMSDDDKDQDADFTGKEKVQDKSADSAENAVNQTKSEHKENN